MESELQVQEYIDFANAIVPGSTDVITDLKTGEVWLELLQLIDKKSFKSAKIKKGKHLSVKDCKRNYMILSTSLSNNDIGYSHIIDANMDDLVAGDEKLHIMVALWFREYFEEHGNEKVKKIIHEKMESMEHKRMKKGSPPAVLIIKPDDEEIEKQTIITTDPVQPRRVSQEDLPEKEHPSTPLVSVTTEELENPQEVTKEPKTEEKPSEPIAANETVPTVITHSDIPGTATASDVKVDISAEADSQAGRWEKITIAAILFSCVWYLCCKLGHLIADKRNGA